MGCSRGLMKTDLIELGLPINVSSLLSLIIKSSSLLDFVILIAIGTLHTFIIFIPIMILNYFVSLFNYYQTLEGSGLMILISIIMVGIIIIITVVKIQLQIAIINKITNISILALACRIIYLGNLIKSYDIINQVYHYKYSIEEFIRALTSISFNIISIFVFIVVVLLKSHIAGVIVLLYSIVMFISTIIVAKISYKIQQNYIEITSKVCSYTFEVINGIIKIIVHNLHLQIFTQIQNLLLKKIVIFKKFMLILQWQNILFMFLSLTIQSTLCTVLYLNQIQINDIIFIIVLSSQILWFSMETSINLKSVYTFQSKAESVKILNNIKQEKNNNINYNDLILGSINLINLSFKCLESNFYLFNNINLSINPKTMICIKGKSGVGKTTLIRIITGFERPSSGIVSFDHYHLKASNLRNIREQLGIILQNHILFYGSIREIVAGNLPLTDENIYYYLTLANFLGDFSKLNLNLDSIISCDGIKLSKGQQQKLVVAQTLAKNPKILILDEALSAVDNESYFQILNNIRNLQVTTIITTHREQNLYIFDQIYTLIDKQLIKVS